jgi:hypothetical protein
VVGLRELGENGRGLPGPARASASKTDSHVCSGETLPTRLRGAGLVDVRGFRQHLAMSTARNAPCPCGSGLKFKRCCAARRRDQAAEVRRDERVGRQAEAWAFAQFGDELAAAGAAGQAELAGSGHAAWIAEHWVMLDYDLRGGGTAAGRYAALPGLTAGDREVAVRIAAARVGVHRVIDSRPGDGMDLEDVLRGGGVTVASAGVSRQAACGDLLVARTLVGLVTSLWGPVRVFARKGASALLEEIARLPGGGSDEDLRCAWPQLMTFSPSEPMPVLAYAAWDIDDAEAAFDLLPEALEYDGDEDGADVLLWRIGAAGDDYGGFFELYEDGIVVYTYAEPLLDEAIALISEALGSRARLAQREVRPLTPARGRAAYRRLAA